MRRGIMMHRTDHLQEATEMALRQLTVRGLDAELERRLRLEARADGLSLNQAALRLIRRGAGLDAGQGRRGAVGTSLDAFIGTWSEEDARALRRSIAVFDGIDEGLWK